MTKTQEYYLEQFKKIDEGKFSWNWSAFLTLGYWVYYRKTYIGMIITNIVGFFLLYIPENIPEKPSPIVTSVGFLLYLIICGAFGNRWYYGTVKRKIKDGYHLDNKYEKTSGGAVTIFLLLAIVVSVLVRSIAPKFGCSEYVVNHIDFWCGTFVFSISFYIMHLIERRKTVIKVKESSSFEINKKNILKII